MHRYFTNPKIASDNFPGIRAATKNSELTIEVYGDIGASFWGDGVTAAQVSQALQAGRGATSVKVRINSPGGSVFEGLTIYNILRSCGVPVTTVVDGLAASAASIIAMAGDKIQMGRGTLLMIHPAWTMLAGDAAALRTEADLLDKITGQMVGIYAKRANLEVEHVRAMVDKETWMSPDEACSLGFADEMTTDEGASVAGAVAAAFDLTVFANTPEALITAAATEPESAEAVPTMSATLQARQRLLDIL